MTLSFASVSYKICSEPAVACHTVRMMFMKYKPAMRFAQATRLVSVSHREQLPMMPQVRRTLEYGR